MLHRVPDPRRPSTPRAVVAVLRLALSVLLASALALPSAAQTPPVKKDASKPTPAALKLPSGAIVIVTDRVGETIQKTDAVYLSPEKYQELREQIEQLQKQLSAEKPAVPNACEIEGRVEQRGGQAVVRLKVNFRFKTVYPRSVVHLGCQKAQPVEARIDDNDLPLLASGDGGLNVLVESADRHTLRLELEAPLSPRGAKATELGFELGLPGAPITTLTFQPPAGVKRLTLNRREPGAALLPGPAEVRRVDAERLAPGRGGEPLGPVTSLEVSWEDPGQPAPAQAARSAEADVVVTVSDAEVQTEARLRLRGTAREWKFLAPATADVAVGKAPAAGADPQAKPVDLPFDQAPTVSRPGDNQPPVWRLQFKEPNAAELLVTVSARMPRPRGSDPNAGRGKFAVGPVAALDVARQSGTVRVRTPPGLRATPVLKGDTRRQDAGDDPAAEAVYRYTSLPAGEHHLPGPPLELDVRPVPGALETRLTHHLQMVEGGWRLRCEAQVTPVRAEVDRLEFEVPAELQNVAVSPPELVEGVLPARDTGPGRRVIPVKLEGPRRAPFQVVVEGLYPQPASAHAAALVLPRLLRAHDRGAEVTVSAPDGVDVRGDAREWDGNQPGAWAQPLEPGVSGLRATLARPVAAVDLSWRPHRPELRVETLADLTLGDAQARVSQQTRCQAAGGVPRRLRLRAPAPVLNLTVAPGVPEELGPGEWLVTLPPDAGREVTLRVQYACNLSARPAEAAQEIPLVWVDGAAQTETRLRVWRDPSAGRSLPTPTDGPWQELPPEVVPDRDTLPALVLHAAGESLPLALRFAAADGPSGLVRVWIDRALVQVQAGDAGQRYRARFQLRKWSARALELELPASAGEVEAFVAGKPVDVRELAEAGGRLLRLPLPAWAPGRSVQAEVRYQLPAGGTRPTLTPPVPQGRVSVAATRWQVALPPRTTPLYFGEAAVVEERWGWPNGLPAPVPARGTVELEAWLASGQEPSAAESPGWMMGESALTARQGGVTPLRLLAVPRPACAVAGSVVAFLGGLMLSRLRRRDAWVLLLTAAALAALAGWFWPQPAMHLAAGTLPGLAVLAAVFGVQHYLGWRYRWRLRNVPAFSRGTAPAATRSTGSHRPAAPNRDPSTVDAPQPEPWASPSST